MYRATHNLSESLLVREGHRCIQLSQDTKFLALYWESQLQWLKHIYYVYSSLTSTFYSIFWWKIIANTNTLRASYFAQVWSGVRYGIIFYGTSCQKLLIAQKLIIRCIAGTSSRSHFKPIFFLIGFYCNFSLVYEIFIYAHSF